MSLRRLVATWGASLLLGVLLSIYSWELVRSEEEPPYRLLTGWRSVVAAAFAPGYVVALITLPDEGSDRGPDPDAARWVTIPANTVLYTLCAGAASHLIDLVVRTGVRRPNI